MKVESFLDLLKQTRRFYVACERNTCSGLPNKYNVMLTVPTIKLQHVTSTRTLITFYIEIIVIAYGINLSVFSIICVALLLFGRHSY